MLNKITLNGFTIIKVINRANKQIVFILKSFLYKILNKTHRLFRKICYFELLNTIYNN